MRIEVKVNRPGKASYYPVHKMVKHGDLWTAHYTTVKCGCHVSRKIVIDGVNAELEVGK